MYSLLGMAMSTMTGVDPTASASPATIAGHSFVVKDREGGLVSLRIALHGGTISELALRLRCLVGVRVTRGPESLGRGRCFVAHGLGFKMVLSAGEKDESVAALVSPMPKEGDSTSGSELSTLLAEMMKPPVARPADGSPWRKGFAFGKPARAADAAAARPTSSLRPVALSKGAPLLRKTPLTRKTPLGRKGRS
jgi:hypothetical protein